MNNSFSDKKYIYLGIKTNKYVQIEIDVVT